MTPENPKLNQDEKVIQMINDRCWLDRFFLLTNQGRIFDLRIKRLPGINNDEYDRVNGGNVSEATLTEVKPF